MSSCSCRIHRSLAKGCTYSQSIMIPSTYVWRLEPSTTINFLHHTFHIESPRIHTKRLAQSNNNTFKDPRARDPLSD